MAKINEAEPSLTSEHLSKLVIIEGVDGAGKTTQVRKLASYLLSLGEDVITPREPGGTEIGEKIREILLTDSSPRSTESEVDLFNIARRELARQVVIPALLAGKWVIQDRREYSTVAYQGFGGGLNHEWILTRCREALGEISHPGKEIIIDVSLETSLLRAPVHSGDNFESKGIEYRRKLVRGYRWLALANNCILINGEQPADNVELDIRQSVLS